MTEYQTWLNSQPKEFQEEILGKNEMGEKFFDYNFRPISLKQLSELDNKHNPNALRAGEQDD